jgi:hypothetical protein
MGRVEPFQISLIIPLISVLGVALAAWLRTRESRHLSEKGFGETQIREMLYRQGEAPAANGWILGGSLVFVLFTVGMGLAEIPHNQEIIFAGSMAIVPFLIKKLTNDLDIDARRVLVGTAMLVFVYRALHRASGHRPGVVDRSDRHDSHAGLDRQLRAAELKATFFAVMASFTNLALSLSQLGTKYLNQIFTISREVRDNVSGMVTTPADYSELGVLLATVYRDWFRTADIRDCDCQEVPPQRRRGSLSRCGHTRILRPISAN